MRRQADGGLRCWPHQAPGTAPAGCRACVCPAIARRATRVTPAARQNPVRRPRTGRTRRFPRLRLLAHVSSARGYGGVATKTAPLLSFAERLYERSYAAQLSKNRTTTTMAAAASSLLSRSRLLQASLAAAVALLLLLQLPTLCVADAGCRVPPEAQHFDIRLTRTAVPAALTQYACQQHTIPSELWHDDYHAVAFQPLIDNVEVMHHMILFGCDDGVSASEPHTCGTQEDQCKSFMTVWTMGLTGAICTYNNTGVLLGKSGAKTLLLQIHWNNVALKNGMADATGMRIFYIRKLRQYNLGNVQFGQNDLEIPPHVQNYAQSGNCSSYCTSQILSTPVYLTRTYIHMHYLGTKGLMQLFRRGQLVANISEASSYNYDQPPIDVHKTAVQVLPGDEVKLTCWFDSKSGTQERNHTVYWGEGSEAEMCYAFVSYFPKTAGFDQCVQFDHFDQCDNYNTGRLIMGSCNYQEFWQTANSDIGLARIHCTSATANQCHSECAAALRRIYGDECMKGRLEVYVKTQFLKTANWENLDKWYHSLKQGSCT